MMSAVDSSAHPVAALPAASTVSVQLLVSLTRALHQVGLPAHRLEETLMLVAGRLGVTLQVMSLPTGVLLSFDDLGQTRILRTHSGRIDLERLAQLSTVADELIAGRLTAAAGLARVEQSIGQPQRWPRALNVLAYGLSAAAFTIFFGGELPELVAGSAVGLAVGVLTLLLPPDRLRGRLFELLAALVATFVATAADYFLGAFVEWIPLAAGLIILLPGIMLVDAIEELAHGRLASGASRLAGVFVVFLALTFGVVLGNRLVELLPGLPPETEPHPLPVWSWVPALAAVSLGSMVRFRARPQDLCVIVLASTLAWLSSRWGATVAGELGGPFLAALVVGFVANGWAYFRRQAAEIVLIPALALLVPGSMGLRSFGALLSQDTTTGIDAAFRMFLIAMALVAGLLFSNMLERDRVPA